MRRGRLCPALGALVFVLVVAAAVSGQVRGAAAMEFAALTPIKADRVVVVKSERRLYLMRGLRVMKSYRVALGRYPRGHKIRSGDSRTPEGTYILDHRLEESAFHKAIHISYPNAADLARASFLGVEAGGRIMIHGLPEKWSARQLDHPNIDWTQGCIAVTNQEIEEIWSLVEDGTPIDIRP